VKAIYRSWGIPCGGKSVYHPRHRDEWLSKITQASVRRRAELYYEQLDALVLLRKQARQELLAEGKKHQAWKLLRSIPALGPIRVAVLMAIVQTPHRFRTKRPLWKYSGFGVVTHTSADHRYVQGQLERSKKPVSVRGLNPNHNHHLKDLFKGAAIQAATSKGPLREFYETLLAKGMRLEMARLTLARKIAVITLTVWKKGVAFDAKYLKSQTA
jgi:transposase